MRRLLMVVAVAGLVASACSSSSTAGLQPSAARSLTPASCTTKGLEAGAANAGPRPIRAGSRPATAYERMRASGRSPSSLARPGDASRSALPTTLKQS